MTPLLRCALLPFILGLITTSITRAQNAAPTFQPPDDVAFQTRDIISEGTRISAEVFAPKDSEGKKLPTIILCHGWGGTAKDLRPEGIAFARAGFLAVAIDYRGWGASDGRLVLAAPAPADRSGSKFTAEVKEIREVVDPLDQTTDLQNAIHWVVGEPRCDASRIGLWGSSYSGGHVAYVAARDPRVKAFVSQVGAFDSRWVMLVPGGREQTFREATKRARGEAGYPEPGVRVIQGLKGAPIRERMMNYAPVEDVASATGCAMLFILAEKEEYFDNKDHGLKAFERAKGPKKLVTIPGITHYGIYGTARPEAQKLAIAWFSEHLKAKDAAAPAPAPDARSGVDAKDWPMYNRDLLGTRHNPAETTLTKANATQLEEKWRFPAKGSDLQIGVIHATPIVVNGYVYIGTATDPTFYKLTPEGKVRWSYRNPARGPKPASARAEPGSPPNARFRSSEGGIFGSPLVTADTVYFADINGWVYALDRLSGAERWTLNTRAEPFPGAHPINVFFASPILVDGKLILGGGTLEQVIAAFPGYKGSTGRGFVLALDPKSGKFLWKHDIGPKPEPFDPPITIKDSWGAHVFYFGPATSSVWSTPSYDAESKTLYFGTDVNTAPRRPTPDNPRLDTPESCAVVALDVETGKRRWTTQLNTGDVWTNAMRSYDPKTGNYKDQSVGDTPKPYTISFNGEPTKVVGVGCKNGGFFVLEAADGKILTHTPIYFGPPTYPLSPAPDKRMLALPSCIGGLQTGCATDGTTIFTNGIDSLYLASQESPMATQPPTAGRVVAISQDTRTEHWRHERPKVAELGGPPPKPVYKDVGDPVASGIAVANGVVYFTAVASGKLVALDAGSGTVLKELEVGPVWSGPSVSRGRVYSGSGNTLFSPTDYEAFFPKRYTGTLYSFGLPGADEVSRMGSGTE